MVKLNHIIFHAFKNVTLYFDNISLHISQQSSSRTYLLDSLLRVMKIFRKYSFIICSTWNSIPKQIYFIIQPNDTIFWIILIKSNIYLSNFLHIINKFIIHTVYKIYLMISTKIYEKSVEVSD